MALTSIHLIFHIMSWPYQAYILYLPYCSQQLWKVYLCIVTWMCLISASACDMWEPAVHGIYMPIKHLKAIYETDLRICKEHCILEYAFICKSVDFYEKLKDCYLNGATIYTQHEYVVSNSDFTYYQRNLDCT